MVWNNQEKTIEIIEKLQMIEINQYYQGKVDSKDIMTEWNNTK